MDRIKALTKTTIEELESDIDMPYRQSTETHKTVCTACGNECEVSFKPDPNRPVYCRECWAKRRPLIERL